MKVNLRGGGQINLKPLAQIADSVEPKNNRDITVTGLTPEELDSEAVKNSIRTYGLSEEEIKKIPHINYDSFGTIDEQYIDSNLSYYISFRTIDSDTFPTVEGSIPLTTSSIFNTKYILYGNSERNNIVLKFDEIETEGDYKALSYLAASGFYPSLEIRFLIKDNLFNSPEVIIGSYA